MELAFIVSAIRRYFWVVLLCALVGALPGLMSGGDAATYKSRGVLLVTPPPSVAAVYSSDPDRYVADQLSVLSSTDTASTVAEAVGNTSPAVVGGAVWFHHNEETDIVEVFAETDDPEFSQQIVDGYLEAYRAGIQQEANSAVEPVEDQIADIRAQLATVDADIEAALAPYVEASRNSDLPIPGADQIVPSLVTQQTTLINELLEAQSQLAQLESDARASVTSTVVQPANLPSEPVGDNRALLVAAGVVAGTFLGMLVAVVAARTSPRVIDDAQAEELLGQQGMGTLVHDRRLALEPTVGVEEPPSTIKRFVDSLCVRAEARAPDSEALTVLVVGTRRAAGTTTLASVVANRFAAKGSSVLLVDADQHRPVLTSVYFSGQPTATAGTARPRAQSVTDDGRDRLRGPQETSLPNLGVASFGTRLMSTKMRRRYVKEGLDQASAMADVVVLDGGPLLETSFTLDLARLSDSVIVAVPPQERVKVLTLVSDETAGRQILPVWTRTHRSFLERFGDFLSGRSRRARIKAKSMSRAVVRKEPRPRPPAVRQPVPGRATEATAITKPESTPTTELPVIESSAPRQ